MRYPNTLDKNVYITYINKNLKNKSNDMNSCDLNWDFSIPESLKELSIRAIAKNWKGEFWQISLIRVNLIIAF